MTQKKEYYAFISYKREDEEQAKWLQNKLECYKFPTNLNGRTDIPKKIRPTFRDVTSLTPGLLEEKINNALIQSEWLIVVCSPRSAKSPWVCKEAQTFIDLGRADHIIPFVIEGIPFSNDETTECYPEALLNLTGSKELLAANINEMGRNAAAIKVIAQMFNLRFDTLWQRHEREEKRKKWMWICGSILIALLSLTIGGCFAKQNQTIEKQNKQLADKIKRIQQDSVIKDNQIKRIQEDAVQLARKNDSIVLQNVLITEQKNDLNRTNQNLKRAHWQMQKNLFKFIAQKGQELIDEGDYYSARVLAINILPKDLKNPDKPFTTEAEILLRNAYARNEGILRGHISKVESIAFNHDGTMLVSASRDHTIRIWDIKTGQLIGEPLEGHTNDVKSASFNHDDTKIVSASYDGTIRIWDVQTGKQIGDSIRVKWNPQNASFNHDGTMILCEHNNGDITIWDEETRIIKKTLHIEGYLEDAKFCPRNDYIVARTSGPSSLSRRSNDYYMIYVWNPKTWEGKTLKGHRRGITSLAVNHDGSMIASAGRDSTIRIWNTVSMGIYDSINVNKRYIGNVTFNSDGSRLLFSTYDTIHVWGVKEKKMLGHLHQKYNKKHDSFIIHESKIASYSKQFIYIYDTDRINKWNEISWFGEKPISAKYNPDKKNIACAYKDGSLSIFDSETGEWSGSLCFWNTGISVSPDEKLILYYGQDIRIINANNYEQIGKSMVGYSGRVNSASFNHDGSQVVSGHTDGTIRIWDVKTSEQIGEPFVGHAGEIKSVAFSPDGTKIVSGSADRTIRIWDIKGQELCRLFEKHKGELNGYEVLFNHDGSKIIALSDSIRIYDINTRDYSHSPINGYSNSKELFSTRCLNDTIYCIYDIMKGKDIGTLQVPKEEIVLGCSHDGTLFASQSSDFDSIRIWDIKTGKQICKPLRSTANLSSGIFNNDKTKFIYCTLDNKMRIWDLKSGKNIRDYDSAEGPNIISFAYNQNGNKIVSWHSDNTIRIWNLETKEEIGKPLVVHAGKIKSVAYSPDETKIASGHTDGTIRFWDMKTRKEIACKEHKGCHVENITFSPNGKRLIYTTYDDLYMWNANTGECIDSLTISTLDYSGGKCEIISVAFSHDGKCFVVGLENGTIRIYNTESFKQTGYDIMCSSDEVRFLSLNHDGTKIVSASSDKTIRIWDVKTGQQIGEPLKGHTGNLYSVNFNHNGTKILSVSNDKSIRIWDFPSLQDLIDETRERFKYRQLTKEDRRKYYLEE